MRQGGRRRGVKLRVHGGASKLTDALKVVCSDTMRLFRVDFELQLFAASLLRLK